MARAVIGRNDEKCFDMLIGVCCKALLGNRCADVLVKMEKLSTLDEQFSRDFSASFTEDSILC